MSESGVALDPIKIKTIITKVSLYYQVIKGTWRPFYFKKSQPLCLNRPEVLLIREINSFH